MYTLLAQTTENPDNITKIDAVGNFDAVVNIANKLIDDFSFPIVEIFCRRKNKIIMVLKLASREKENNE